MNGWTCDSCGQAYDDDYGCACTDSIILLSTWGSLVSLVESKAE